MRNLMEICANGVEYKALGEIADISRGRSYRGRDFVNDGVQCINFGQVYAQCGLTMNKTDLFVSAEKAREQKRAVKNDIIMAVRNINAKSGNVCKCVAWDGDGEPVVDDGTVIIHHAQNPKYLLYYFQTMEFMNKKESIIQGASFVYAPPEKLARIVLPVPTLQAQSEIVYALGKLTGIKKWQKERCKQFEYYRELLFAT